MRRGWKRLYESWANSMDPSDERDLIRELLDSGVMGQSELEFLKGIGSVGAQLLDGGEETSEGRDWRSWCRQVGNAGELLGGWVHGQVVVLVGVSGVAMVVPFFSVSERELSETVDVLNSIKEESEKGLSHLGELHRVLVSKLTLGPIGERVVRNGLRGLLDGLDQGSGRSHAGELEALFEEIWSITGAAAPRFMEAAVANISVMISAALLDPNGLLGR